MWRHSPAAWLSWSVINESWDQNSYIIAQAVLKSTHHTTLPLYLIHPTFPMSIFSFKPSLPAGICLVGIRGCQRPDDCYFMNFWDCIKSWKLTSSLIKKKPPSYFGWQPYAHSVSYQLGQFSWNGLIRQVVVVQVWEMYSKNNLLSVCFSFRVKRDHSLYRREETLGQFQLIMTGEEMPNPSCYTTSQYSTQWMCSAPRNDL